MIRRFGPDSYRKENWCTNEFHKIDKIFVESGHPIGKGPYIVKKAFLEGALIFTKMDGKELSNPINVDIVKKHYA